MLQVQEQYEHERAEVAKLTHKLAEDVAETEELQNGLTALEDKFASIKRECAGDHQLQSAASLEWAGLPCLCLQHNIRLLAWNQMH